LIHSTLNFAARFRVILAEKTDRLHGNLKDYATLDVKEWGLTIHLVKEGENSQPDSKSSH
jgi:hypothetical protein